MKNLSVVGAQWGDEGKGKIVDLLSERADVVVRFAGGANAGHTLEVDGQRIVVHLLPSGVVRRGKSCVLGAGMVIDPEALLAELSDLGALGLRPDSQSLRISDRASLVLPYHRELDGLREAGPGALGTTRRGIGPAYEDKVARRGLRLCDLRHPDRLHRRLVPALEQANAQIRLLGGTPLKLDGVEGPLLARASEILPYVDDTSAFVAAAVRGGKRLLFEGAQGMLLDVDHGTYPYVTSSSTLASGACAGVGIGPQHLGDIIGVTKAYATRVGDGPFPTEICGEEGERLRDAGQEYGATTGRARRCGWLDLPALRYAIRVGGLQWLALTKLDVLAGIGPLKVCVAYRLRGRELDAMPPDPDDLAEVDPVYEQAEGFEGDLGQVRSVEALPAAARAFVELLERQTGIRVCLASVGPGREQSIVRHEI